MRLPSLSEQHDLVRSSFLLPAARILARTRDIELMLSWDINPLARF
jgi:hypothetical protein